MKSFFSALLIIMIFWISSISAQTKWTKHPNPVLYSGSAGTWEDWAVYAPCVLKDGDTLKMWYTGAKSWDVHQIGYATSLDGIHWKKHPNNPVLTVGKSGSWDASRVVHPRIILINGTYHMWYGGTSDPPGYAFRLGYATSPDGINWTKYHGNPIKPLGDEGEWNSATGAGHSYLYDGDSFHNWTGGCDGPDWANGCIGYVESKDGINWDEYNNNPVFCGSGSWDSEGAMAPFVLVDGTGYQMWYQGYDDLNTRIGYATSVDGIHWKAFNSFVLDIGKKGQWDDSYVVHPYVLEGEDLNKMWYCGGRSNSGDRIGYATAPVSRKVPGQYTTIQKAIDAAKDGEIVLVDEGTYYENINFKGKAITVASNFYLDDDTSHISKTIIDGSQNSNPDSGSVVYFVNGEDTTSVLMGFTITGGTGTYDPGLDGYGGGGINIVGQGSSGGKIIHNNIINNHLISSQKLCGGAGLIAFFAEPDRNLVIEHNEIKNNSVTCPVNTQGGGIYSKWVSKTGYTRISNNIITGNSVTCTGTYKAIAGGIGLSIDLPSDVDATIENNIISHNELHCKASMGAGIYIVYWSDRNVVINDDYPTPIIANNLIYNNYSQDKGAGIGLWTVGLNTQSKITPQPQIINNTLYNNKSSDGCALFNFDCFPLIMNNIFWDDLSIEDSQEIFNSNIDYRPDYLKTKNDGKIYVYYSDIQGGWEGESNINADPLFADTLTFTLSESSSCIGAGIESIELSGTTYHCPSTCYLGHPRPLPAGSKPDLGAIESPLGSDIENFNPVLPKAFTLKQNYPNPFNPITTIEYQLPKASKVELSIYNILGQKVCTLVSEKQPAGKYEMDWDASGFSSGIYFYKLETDAGFSEAKKLVLMK